MPAPPALTELADTYPNPNNATFKAGITKLLNFAVGLLGSTGNTPEAQDGLRLASSRMANLALNADAAIWQQGVATVADATHGFDRFVSLCTSGNVTVSQLSQPVDGIPYAMRQLQPDASAKRIGWCQQLEAKECIAYRGEQLVFAPKVRASGATTIRVALVAWTGTLDAPPRDVVNNWASTNYTAGNFFIANTLPIAVGSVAVGAATWTDIPVSSVSPGGVVAPSSMNNLYLVVWTDSAVAQNFTLDSSMLRAGRGTQIPIWAPPDPALELAKMQRTYEVGNYFDSAYASAGIGIGRTLPFKVTKRVTPTLGLSGLAEVNANSSAVGSPTVHGLILSYNVTATGVGSSSGSWSSYAGF